MNLSKLFEIQAKLDERIKEEHNLQGQDLMDKKMLALQVELGELANELPEVFKFWSHKKNNYEKALKEYVDGLHFILSIGLDLGIRNVDVAELGDYTEETTTKTFISIQSDTIAIVDDLETDIFNKFAQEDYKTLLARFIGLGELQLGFTWEQIEQAYLDKNKVNHERQANGY